MSPPTTEHVPTVHSVRLPIGPNGWLTLDLGRLGQVIADLTNERDRARDIAVALEAELAETTDELKAGLIEWHATTHAYLEQRDRAAVAQATAETLLTEVAAIRAQVAELTRLNAEGRPWQITRAEADA